MEYNIFNYAMEDYSFNQKIAFSRKCIDFFKTKKEINEEDLINNKEVLVADIIHKNLLDFSHPIYSNFKTFYLDPDKVKPLFDEYIAKFATIQTLIGRNGSDTEEYKILTTLSKSVFQFDIPTSALLETIQTLITTYKESEDSELVGIVVKAGDKFYNVTHPIILDTIISNFDDFKDMSSNCQIFVYYTDKKEVEKLNIEVYENFNKELVEQSSEHSPILETLPELIKENVLFSLMFYGIKSNILKKYIIDKNETFSDITDKDIYIRYINSNYHNTVMNVGVFAQVGTQLPKLNTSNKELYKNYYLVPIDLFSKDINIPFYGNAIVHETIFSVPKKNLILQGANISLMQSNNIRTEYPRLTNSVCTGSLRSRSTETIGSLNISNANSAYQHTAFSVGFLDIIRTNIDFSLDFLNTYFGENDENKHTNEEINQENNDEKNKDNYYTQPTEIQGISESTQCGSESVETEVAQPNNPFEWNISYEQRVSGSHVESSNEERVC